MCCPCKAIAWTPIDEPDNEATIRMLSNRQGQPVGLFPLLDEQCALQVTVPT